MNLAALLDDDRARHAPAYGGGLTNHLPMCLVALHRLGATDNQAAAFARSYGERVHLEAARSWPRAQAYIDEVRSKGADAALREHLKHLLPGLVGAAFHGVIRLAYAMLAREVDGAVEGVGSALAYLHDSAMPSASMTTGAGSQAALAASGRTTTDLGALADRLRAQRIPSPPRAATISERLAVAIADPRFGQVVHDLAVDNTTLSQVSGLGARWYLRADDFVSLHVLTGAHALRVLRPWIDDEKIAWRALAVAALACFVVAGSPERSDARGLPRADDRELKTRALSVTDDHIAKLLFTCIEEEKAEEDQIYRIVATRAARRGTT